MSSDLVRLPNSGSKIYSEPPQATQWKDQVLDVEDTFEDRSPFLRWLPEHAQGCLHWHRLCHLIHLKWNEMDEVDGFESGWKSPQARFAGWSRSSPCAQKYQHQQHSHHQRYHSSRFYHFGFSLKRWHYHQHYFLPSTASTSHNLTSIIWHNFIFSFPFLSITTLTWQVGLGGVPLQRWKPSLWFSILPLLL